MAVVLESRLEALTPDQSINEDIVAGILGALLAELPPPVVYLWWHSTL